MLEILLNLMGKVALLVALGYVLTRRGLLTERFQKDLTAFMMQVALPANVLTTASNPFSAALSKNLLITVAVALVYYIAALALTALVGRALPLERRERAMFTLMAVFANTAFLGFPLISELLGQEGLLYAVVFNMVWLVFFFTIGISMVSMQRQIRIKSILSMPVTIASLAAVVLYVSPFRFPVFIQDTLSTLGSMVVPISMLLIGCSLVPIRPVEILKDPWSYAVNVLRLAVFPLAVLGILCLIPGVPHLVALVCAVMCCLPSASLSVVFAQQYDCAPAFASRAVVQGMVLMIVTIPLFITLAVTALPL
ncbi:AEC family transporter [uncultured Oscillibacter sp.]|uniref:AEC family transporter n=1 Tax=uncultured Oscillibacter sp. TaxID=876091 RepID=UPI0025E6CF04|nr:AEC family transporter [uncultured Oscillibacter sp.]